MIPRRKRTTVKGTNLYVDVRTGNYVWRRTDDDTGARIKRSTQTRNLTYALQRAIQFEDEHQRRRTGLTVFDGWKKPLKPIAVAWLDTLRDTTHHRQLRANVLRAIGRLGISTPADLDNVPRLHERLLRLEGQKTRFGPITRLMLRRAFRVPLKSMSKGIAAQLGRDPLATWARVDTSDVEREERHAYDPALLARAFVMLERLDDLYGRKHPSRPVYLALLVTGARVSALASRDVTDLDRRRSRVELGAGSANKRRGEAALDAATLAELMEYADNRQVDAEGGSEAEAQALFLSPTGIRLDRFGARHVWRDTLLVAAVDELWPEDEPRDLETELFVANAIQTGRVRVSWGGNPNVVRETTVEKRAELTARVGRLVRELREPVLERLKGLDVHSFRTTHRTWAEIKGVHPVVIDKQLGHSTPGGSGALETARQILASPTGRKHYLDLSLALFEPRKSAEAVRALLDEAIASLKASGGESLVAGDRVAHQESPGTRATHAG